MSYVIVSLAFALVRRCSARTLVRHVAAKSNVDARHEYVKVQRRLPGISVREYGVNGREIRARFRSAA